MNRYWTSNHPVLCFWTHFNFTKIQIPIRKSSPVHAFRMACNPSPVFKSAILRPKLLVIRTLPQLKQRIHHALKVVTIMVICGLQQILWTRKLVHILQSILQIIIFAKEQVSYIHCVQNFKLTLKIYDLNFDLYAKNRVVKITNSALESYMYLMKLG